jgi:hypothetical protein
MIKFFRKIRLSLLSDNKFNKYLIYALGEIILVVVGILIAIQLNAWKTEAEESAKVLEYMNGLYSELNQDYERMDSLYKFYSDKTNSIQLLLKSYDQKKPLTNDELGKLFNSSLEHKKFSNKKSTYLSLISDGFRNNVNDKDLVTEIIKYYESPYLIWSTEIYGNILESIDFNKSEIYNSQDRLIELTMNNSIPKWQLTNKKYQTNYTELLRSKWAINILTSCLKQSDFIFKNLDNYKEMNDHLKKEIEIYKNEG